MTRLFDRFFLTRADKWLYWISFGFSDFSHLGKNIAMLVWQFKKIVCIKYRNCIWENSGSLTNLKVLVVGGGAREHSICDAVYRSKDAELYSVMKNLNPGIQLLATDYFQEKETNVEKVVRYAMSKRIDLVIVGPEAPLEAGIINELNKAGIKACSPTKEAARIETDKEWMRNLLKKYNILGQLKCESFTDVKKEKNLSRI